MGVKNSPFEGFLVFDAVLAEEYHRYNEDETPHDASDQHYNGNIRGQVSSGRPKNLK